MTCSRGSPPGSPTRSVRSTGWSSTSRASPRAPSSGSKGEPFSRGRCARPVTAGGRGPEQCLRQGENRVLQGRDALGNAGAGGFDRPGHRLLHAGGLGVELAVDRAHPVVLVVEALVEALKAGG